MADTSAMKRINAHPIVGSAGPVYFPATYNWAEHVDGVIVFRIIVLPQGGWLFAPESPAVTLLHPAYAECVAAVMTARIDGHGETTHVYTATRGEGSGKR